MGRRRHRAARGARRRSSPPAQRSEPAVVEEPEWVWIGDRRMFVVGYTPGGVPYGYVEGQDDRSAADEPFDMID